MRKEWVKRENIYFKPFYKQKSKMMLLFLFLLTLIVYFYIGNYVNNLPVTSTPYLNISTFFKETNSFTTSKLTKLTEEDNEIKIIRGIRLRDYHSYKMSFDKKFRCLDNSKSMPYKYLNDNYCDCQDGSDEPSTNACANGKFYCKYQKRHLTGRGRDFYVTSSLINDGVCDCCDGSDEWETSIQCVYYCL